MNEIKEGLFVGPQIKKLFKDSKFEAALEGGGKEAWDAFQMVVTHCLVNKKQRIFQNGKQPSERL